MKLIKKSVSLVFVRLFTVLLRQETPQVQHFTETAARKIYDSILTQRFDTPPAAAAASAEAGILISGSRLTIQRF